MSPLQAFKQALFYVSGLCSSRTLNKPGAVIERLSEETRQSLQQLKSEDIGPEVRVNELKYFVGTDEYYQQQEFKQDRLAFDKKIKK